MEFTLRMGELGKLLQRYRDAELALPPRAFYLIWFLHNAKEKERNLQARLLVQQLLEAMTPQQVMDLFSYLQSEGGNGPRAGQK